MIDIKVLRAMASAGATVEMILAAVEAAQSEHDKKVAARRTKDAARQQRNRQKHRSSSATVTRSHELSRGPSDDVCDMSGIYTTPSIEVDKKESKEVDARKRKTRLPEGFTLSAASSLFAEARGWCSARIQSEFNRFCDHARANGRTQIDWDAAWRNWVTSPFQKPEQMNGNHARTASDVLREMCEGNGSGARQDTGWLLPED